MLSLCFHGNRVLCETVKDFVARVGKAYEKNTESSEESEAMAKKVAKPRSPAHVWQRTAPASVWSNVHVWQLTACVSVVC